MSVPLPAAPAPVNAKAVDPWEKEKQKETDTITLRRKLAELDEAASPLRWGLALSGGGVRSATFCLGVVRALAKKQLLRQMDFLSTVSGGGYLGASVGRLFDSSNDAKKVEAGIASNESLWFWWLRVNGRYLTPAGAKDLGIASASILRGMVATYFELTALIFILVALVLFPHIVVAVGATKQWTWLRLGVLGVLPSAWWWLALIPLAIAAQQSSAFWCVAMGRNFWGKVLTVVGAVSMAVVGTKGLIEAGQNYWAFDLAKATVAPQAIAFWLFLGTLLLMPVLGTLQWIWVGTDNLSHALLQRTRRLATCLVWVTFALGFGVLDAASWFIADNLRGATFRATPVNVALVTTALVAALRVALPPIKQALAQARFQHVNVERLLNVLGLMCLLLLVLVWATAIHAYLLPIELWQGTWPASQAAHRAGFGYALIFGIPALYVLLSMSNYQALNMSSLHEFYRARIEMAYVSSGNGKGRFGGDALLGATLTTKNAVKPLREALAEDDVDVYRYKPHDKGGPIHIVNCCINQSVDDRTDSYNADRKGVALGISSLGVEVGLGYPQEPPDGMKSLGALSKWVAISGAAASTGMGSMTSPGLAALLFLSGLRLGFWTPRLRERQLPQSTGRLAWLVRKCSDFATKPNAIVAETMARFPGLESPAWYVSDGGHFDNTAIYPLIKREVDVIIAADCGADPNYLFEDLESLVRKARLDFHAEIEFYQGDDPGIPADLADLIESPEVMSPAASPRCLVLGRITYTKSKKRGTLIVIKPRRLKEMPFDVVAYADRERVFPQQSTADQFFDEAQWESYQRLGYEIGEKVSRHVIDCAIQLTHSETVHPRSLSIMANTVTEKAEDRRSRASPAVRASIGVGIGVILSAGLAIWQGVREYQVQYAKDDQAFIDDVDEFIKKIGENPFTMNSVQNLATLHEKSQTVDLPEQYARAHDAWMDKCKEGQGGQDVDPDVPVDATLLCEAKLAFEKRQGHRYWMDDITRVSNTKFKRTPLDLSATIEGCPQEEAQKITLVTQIYDEASRPGANNAIRIASSWGFKLDAIENVVQTAERKGTRPPLRWDRPSLLTHKGVNLECAADLSRLLELPKVYIESIEGKANTIELWLPPTAKEEVVSVEP